jgi:hypothetical protein
MTIDTAFAALVDANPIPDAETYAENRPAPGVFLTATRERDIAMTDTETTVAKNDRSRGAQQNRRNILVGLTAFVAVLVVGVAAWLISSLDEDGSSPVVAAADNPADTIEAYAEANNSGDIDAVMVLFTEESTIVDFPHDPNPNNESEGLDEIRALLVADMSGSAESDSYTISNVEVTGSTVSWDHLYVNNKRQGFCRQGNVAEVQDGKILHWTFAAGRVACS